MADVRQPDVPRPTSAKRTRKTGYASRMVKRYPLSRKGIPLNELEDG